MRITIDNQDGQGALDYTGYVSTEGPITILRALNAPSRCTVELTLAPTGPSLPHRKGRMVISRSDGDVLFTGYLAVEPATLSAGSGVEGPVFRARLTAISDEWLLNKQGSGASTASNGLVVGADATALVRHMTQAIQNAGLATSLTVSIGENPRALGAFAVQPGAGWSTNAAAAANASYASYRVVNGTVSMNPIGSSVHVLSESEGNLAVGDLQVSHARELANDVTLSGAQEPTAYVQEIFYGDGSTTEFLLSGSAFRGENRILLRDNFDGAAFDSSQWQVRDGANHLQLTSAGLTMNGGNGFDGQTTLQAVNTVEMGGSILAELNGVVFGPASDGMLGGFYSGPVSLANCFAGFRVRQSVSSTGGATVVVPLVNGAEAGSVFAPAAGHRYTLRLRMYCVEMQRIPQKYYCMVDGTVQSFGSNSGIPAPMQFVFDILDEGLSSNTPATVLYDTAVSASAMAVSVAACTFVAANSTSLHGSVLSLSVTRLGSLWVSSVLPNGDQVTRLCGGAGEGCDCSASYGSAGTPGKVSFFAGRIPLAGERLIVNYRAQGHSVARIADAASVATEQTGSGATAIPGVSRWLGKVVAPAARSSADCEMAAQAVLAMATARSAAASGSYEIINPPEDMWPGDVLQVTNTDGTSSFLVRSVKLQDHHACAEVISYQVVFANDWATEWADGLGLELREGIGTGVQIPTVASNGAGEVLSNLQELKVISLQSNSIQVDAGLAAPSGGGFEVRRKDYAFGAGVDANDLVLRSPVRSFSIPRSTGSERFYVRMYDGSTPPIYSRFSSAVFVNWPTS